MGACTCPIGEYTQHLFARDHCKPALYRAGRVSRYLGVHSDAPRRTCTVVNAEDVSNLERALWPTAAALIMKVAVLQHAPPEQEPTQIP